MNIPSPLLKFSSTTCLNASTALFAIYCWYFTRIAWIEHLDLLDAFLSKKNTHGIYCLWIHGLYILYMCRDLTIWCLCNWNWQILLFRKYENTLMILSRSVVFFILKKLIKGLIMHRSAKLFLKEKGNVGNILLSLYIHPVFWRPNWDKMSDA